MKLKTTLAAAALISLVSTGAMAAGDKAKGQALYTTCAACHGQNGEGQEALNAPKLAGQEEWYVVRQLQNFKTGVRGASPQDVFGMQMAPMSQLLTDDQAMEDVAAYVKSLAK
ncbi:MAG: c-type cytochrome [Pseudomonadales bacterium]|jgi:cytochrome c oxidase subunit 2|nr:c-type cytochrome [Pseudomonadales bacterium]